MARNEIARKRMRWVSGLLLILAGCVESPATAPTAAAPIPSGQARVWFYRPWEPSESLDLALIDMNGSSVGAVANGSAFYRDVLPGDYHIAPESFGRDFNQDRNVDLVCGFSCQAVVLGCADSFLFGAGKAVFRPVACNQVPGGRGRGQGTETLAELGGLPPSVACVSQRLDA